MNESKPKALLATRNEGECLIVRIGGDWIISSPHLPEASEVVPALEQGSTHKVRVEDGGIHRWDSALLLFLYQLRDYCQQHDLELDGSSLPSGVQRLLNLATAVTPAPKEHVTTEPGLLTQIGMNALDLCSEAYAFIHFIGDATLSAFRFIKGKARYRARDLWLLIQECGPNALPIVTLISLLVGLILAYVGALQLAMFGAQIYVADLVGIGTVREMGAMMTAIIMAGRTGSAYAAQLGTMQVNEEIDALKTLGLSPMEFLVLPRMLALILMVPLLTLYADLVGIVGGGLASVALFDLTVLEYVNETQQALDMEDIFVGVFKAAVFGILIATAGCLRGMQCKRSAQAVGEAATSAVVTSIVAIVISDALLTVLFTKLGI